MRTIGFFLAAAFLGALFAAPVEAQLQQPRPARPVTALHHNTYYIQDQPQPSPSDIVPAPGEADLGPAPFLPPGDEFDVEEDEEEEEAEGPARLFNEFWGIQIGGWVSSGIYQNFDGNHRGFGNQPLGFRNVADSYTLDQAYIYAERALPDDPCLHDWGFRFDYIFGVDAPDTQAFGDIGWDTKWQTSRDYGHAIPQLYAEFGNADFWVRAGKFYTLIGYEVVTAPDNFFYSHAYTMFYGEPFTHTGVLVGRALTDQIGVVGGYTLGWDSGFNNANDAHTFLGSVTWTSCDERMSWTYAVVAGNFGSGDVANQGDIYMHSVVGIYQINDCTEYVFQHDYGRNTGSADGDVEWGGINQYLFYTLSSCWRAGLRAEWFSDTDGVRVGQGVGDYYAITAGLNYTPNSNVIIRPEMRYDRFDGIGRPFNPNAAGDGLSKEQFFWGFDVIVIF